MDRKEPVLLIEAFLELIPYLIVKEDYKTLAEIKQTLISYKENNTMPDCFSDIVNPDGTINISLK